jgi:AraC-like DNA-binding protein
MEYYPDEENPWEYIWVDFTGEQVENWRSLTGFDETHPVCEKRLGEKLLPCFLRLQNLDIYQREMREADGILMTILGIYQDGFPSGQGEKKQAENRMETAVLLIQNNYHKKNFNVEKICEIMGISRGTMYRLFRNETGLSPNRYLMDYRMEQAKKMLAMGTSVKNVAASCGFGDVFYFSRAFKKYAGSAPSRYTIK